MIQYAKMGLLHREFESHPLCIKPRLALLVLGFILGNGFELKQSLALFEFERERAEAGADLTRLEKRRQIIICQNKLKMSDKIF